MFVLYPYYRRRTMRRSKQKKYWDMKNTCPIYNVMAHLLLIIIALVAVEVEVFSIPVLPCRSHDKSSRWTVARMILQRAHISTRQCGSTNIYFPRTTTTMSLP